MVQKASFDWIHYNNYLSSLTNGTVSLCEKKKVYLKGAAAYLAQLAEFKEDELDGVLEGKSKGETVDDESKRGTTWPGVVVLLQWVSSLQEEKKSNRHMI